MLNPFVRFLLHWAITSASLWIASRVFAGFRFADASSLIIAALVLGFANTVVRPVLVVLTFPLTIFTLGFFLLVVNAVVLLLVSTLVPGFVISGFWTAFFASIFIAVTNFFIQAFLAAAWTRG